MTLLVRASVRPCVRACDDHVDDSLLTSKVLVNY